MREPYSQWAEGHINRIKKVLNDARAEHTGVVKERIESVGQMKDVVSITQALFALSKVSNRHLYLRKSFFRSSLLLFLILIFICTHIPISTQETAKLESENFVQQQKIAVAGELRSVLDSWARYEQQVKESEQADLTKSVIDKVVASLKDDKTQRDILASAVTEVERE